MIKAIAFDFDHTLYDRDKTYEAMVDSFMSYFKDYLRTDLSREELLKTLQDCDKSGIYKAGHWEGIYADTVAAGIFDKIPTYEQYYNEYMEYYYPRSIVMSDDTFSSLEKLRADGYTLGILTNGPSGYQRDKINNIGLVPYVDTVVVGGELPEPKPYRSAFEAVCREMHCQPGEAAYVGDNPRTDMEGCRRAGMTPIWIRSVGSWPEGLERVRYHIDRLGELPELIAEINRKIEAK